MIHSRFDAANFARLERTLLVGDTEDEREDTGMNLLEMSISAAVMILIVLLARSLGKKNFSKTVIIFLWDLILIRALLPFQVPLGDIPIWKRSYSESVVSRIDISGYKVDQVSALQLEETERLSNSWQIVDYLPALWLIGVLCLCFYFVRIYVKEHQLLKECIPIQNETAERLIRGLSIHRKIRLYEGEDFRSPVTYGVLRPKIVIPRNLYDISRVDMRNMIAHELVHIQRYDVAKRFCMLAALCIHWFNPLMWVMYHCYRADQEMACDEGVLRNMAGEKAKNYVYTMIKMASGGGILWSTTGFIGKNAERKRILAAMNQKRQGKGSMLTTVILGLCLVLPFFSFVQTERVADRERTDVQGEAVNTSLEKQEVVETERTLLSPSYEGRFKSPSVDNFDYKAVMQDIVENYNDLSQPFAEDQIKALDIQNYIVLANIYKEQEDRGIKLDPTELWIVDEFYGFDDITGG